MKLTTPSSPHIRASHRTDRIMLDVVLALLPALIVGIVMLGIRALLITALSVVCALGFELLWCLLTKKESTLPDGSALVTGILFAMTLPTSIPLWQVIVGDFFAIVIIKGLFGGLGQNVFNPALAARAFVLLISPLGVTKYPVPDGVSSATPLHQMVMESLPEQSLLDMFLGNCPGSIGEICSLALLTGGAYLVLRKVISVRIPLAYIGTVALLTLIFFKGDNAFVWMLYNLLSGGLLLGAIFMATDYVTSPVTPKGQLLYGIGCGALTVLFRYYGLYPEGITYAILLMNACAWSIDCITAPRRFGKKKGERA